MPATRSIGAGRNQTGCRLPSRISGPLCPTIFGRLRSYKFATMTYPGRAWPAGAGSCNWSLGGCRPGAETKLIAPFVV